MMARAAAVDDLLDLDGERLILINERVIVLSPVASVVHRLLPIEAPIDVVDLLARVAAELPLPPEPEEALRGLLLQLSAEALVALTP